MLSGDEPGPRGRLLAAVLALIDAPVPMDALTELFAPTWGGSQAATDALEDLIRAFGWLFIPLRGGLGLSAVFKRHVAASDLDPTMSAAVSEARELLSDATAAWAKTPEGPWLTQVMAHSNRLAMDTGTENALEGVCARLLDLDFVALRLELDPKAPEGLLSDLDALLDRLTQTHPHRPGAVVARAFWSAQAAKLGAVDGGWDQRAWEAACETTANTQDLVGWSDFLESWPTTLRRAPAHLLDALLSSGEAHPSLTLARRLEAPSLDDKGASVLAGCAALSSLTSLVLPLCRLSAQGARSLAASPHLAGLEELAIARGDLGKEGIEALITSPHLTGLTSLSLCFGAIGDRGLKALVASPFVAHLEALHLSDNGLGSASAVALTTSPHLRGLKTLTYDHNITGNDGAKAFARSQTLTSLKRLDLSNNHIRDVGATALAWSIYAHRLEHLDLRHNSIGARGTEALLASPGLKKSGALVFDPSPST